jgi:hypothetical protein
MPLRLLRIFLSSAEPSDSIDSFIYHQLLLIYEAFEMGMHTAKNKPLTKKEREERRKKKKEKELAK